MSNNPSHERTQPEKCRKQEHKNLPSRLCIFRNRVFNLIWRHNWESDEVEIIKGRLEAEDDGKWGDNDVNKHADIQHKLDRAERVVSVLRSQAEALQRDLHETKILSESRRRDLKAAQAFLSTADDLSVQDVIRNVNNLNNLISQASSVLEEDLDNRTPDGNPNIALVEQQTGTFIAQRLLSQDSNLPLGLVLQFLLVSWSKEVLDSWDSVPGASANLQDIYACIRQNTDQSVAGKWRSITRSANAEGSTTRRDLLSYIQRFLFALGFIIDEDFIQFMEPRLFRIADHVLSLKESFGAVTSIDLEVIVVHPGSSFEPNTMIDEDAGRKSKKRKDVPNVNKSVLGTTELGLMGGKIISTARGEREVAESIFTKPKVILVISQ